ncbi:hypothetical protein LAWI1_G006824 [Lachnellula willkommii]|uniref:Uncharacterized protein n=1 Tax=Lachnellula willkommii TaxID=215461 RepID=A0A559LZG7_9HELO|nr:hypothetical protein LAWI1_G006824 [Lachnellula willkommii]
MKRSNKAKSQFGRNGFWPSLADAIILVIIIHSGQKQDLKLIPTYKDLLPDLQDQNDSTGAQIVEGLDEWFSGMDDLGTLVTMAVSAL